MGIRCAGFGGQREVAGIIGSPTAPRNKESAISTVVEKGKAGRGFFCATNGAGGAICPGSFCHREERA